MDCSQNNREGKRVSLPLQNGSINKWPYLHLWTFPNLWPTNRLHTLHSLVNSVLTRLFVSHLTQPCALVRELCAKQWGSGRFISNLIRLEALSIRENQNLAFIRKLQSTSFKKNVSVSCKKKKRDTSSVTFRWWVCFRPGLYPPGMENKLWKNTVKKNVSFSFFSCGFLYANYYYNFALNCYIASSSNY